MEGIRERPDCDGIKKTHRSPYYNPGPLKYSGPSDLLFGKTCKVSSCLWSDHSLPAQPVTQPCFTYITSIPITKIGRTAQYPHLCLLCISGLLFKLGLKGTTLSYVCTPLPVLVPASHMLPHLSTPLTLSLANSYSYSNLLSSKISLDSGTILFCPDFLGNFHYILIVLLHPNLHTNFHSMPGAPLYFFFLYLQPLSKP